MKNWQITGFLTILILGFLLISGCTQDNNKYCNDTYPGTLYDPSSKMCEPIVTQTPQIVYVTVFVTPTLTPTITATENIDSIRTKLNSEWRQIQDVYDTFTINLNKVLTHSSDQDLVGVTIPNTISQYQKIKNDLLNININDSDLKSERTVLVSICNYKINYLQGTSSAYHAPQVETYDLQKSLTEYTDAKHYFQDERDIINDIPYSSKYWDYVYKDERLAEKNIVLVEENILRISKLLP